MTWLRRYRLGFYASGTLWVAPMLAVPLAMLFGKAVRILAERSDWVLVGVGPEGARALLAAYIGATLSFIVFVFTMLLLSVQLASAQLSPRLIATVMRDRAPKLAVATFVFSLVYDIGAMARIDERVIELPLLVASCLTGASVFAFLYLIDRTTRRLRPASVIEIIGTTGREVIEAVYPDRLPAGGQTEPRHGAAPLGAPQQVVSYEGSAGVLLAFDEHGLAALARRLDCTLVLLPQIGDFVAPGEPLFHVFGRSDGVDDGRLRQSVALGRERMTDQDPAFCFRLLVEIASKALSPAINDPSTAVLAIDQIHRLLRSTVQRDLDTGRVHDETGALRLVYRTPDWEDLVSLAIAEIRLFGAGSLQIARRLRAMIESLLRVAPPERAIALRQELELLDRSIERSFVDPEDRVRASVPDSQGLGGHA